LDYFTECKIKDFVEEGAAEEEKISSLKDAAASSTSADKPAWDVGAALGHHR
jgi:hypothetical protein